MAIKKEVYDLKINRELKSPINVSYSILDKNPPKDYGRMVRLDFLDDDNCEWGVFIVQKLGIHIKMPKKFFEKQIKDNKSDGLEFTFTTLESDAILELIRLYQKGSSYLKEIKNNKFKVGEQEK